MLVKDIAEKLNLEVINSGDGLNRDVKNCYIGDLLSWVMSNACENDIWITIMSNVNVAAVATLTDVACVLLCENVVPDNECIENAKKQGITLLKSPLTAYQIAVEIGNIL